MTGGGARLAQRWGRAPRSHHDTHGPVVVVRRAVDRRELSTAMTDAWKSRNGCRLLHPRAGLRRSEDRAQLPPP